MKKRRGTNWEIVTKKMNVAKGSHRNSNGSISLDVKKGTHEYRMKHPKDEVQMRACLERVNVVPPKKGKKAPYKRHEKHRHFEY